MNNACMAKATRSEINKNLILLAIAQKDKQESSKTPLISPARISWHDSPVQLTLLIPSAHWQPLPPKTESGI